MTTVSNDSPVLGSDLKAPTFSSRHVTVIQPTHGWAVFDLAEFWRYRDLFLALAARDVKLRYRQTALGVIWVLVQPLVASVIFTVLFSKVANFPSGHVPYFLLTLTGSLGWTAFQNTMTKTSNSLIGNAQLVSKVYFPRLILPLSTVVSSLIDFAVCFVVMIALLIVYRVTPHLGFLLFPVWLLLMLMQAIGFGLYAGALMVSYRDIQYVLPIVIQMGAFATPVYYSMAFAAEKTPSISWFFYMNPLSGLLEAMRWSILSLPGPNLGTLLYSVIASVLIFIGGVMMFRRMERKFADVI
ncbi:MAG: ABC transporter permease [Armatimonadota bacterium]